jgi:hypothetical protein
MITVPAPRRALFILTLLYLLALFLWLSEEDSIVFVTALGIGLAVLLMAHALVRRAGSRQMSRRRWLATLTVSGLMTGAGASLATVTLMAVKVSIHGHPGALDYPPETLIAVLTYLPGWALAGALGGLGVGLIVSALAL